MGLRASYAGTVPETWVPPRPCRSLSCQGLTHLVIPILSRHPRAFLCGSHDPDIAWCMARPHTHYGAWWPQGEVPLTRGWSVGRSSAFRTPGLLTVGGRTAFGTASTA